MSQIWKNCRSKKWDSLDQTTWRLDRTGYSPSEKLTDSEEDQLILQKLIKPIFISQEKTLPLKYASRFGTRWEAAIRYSSLEMESALAEKAFYLFDFLRAAHLASNDLLFAASRFHIKSSKAIDLTKTPFLNYRSSISSATDYKESQALGKAMRSSGVEVFIYYSARDINDGVNAGSFYANNFKKNNTQNIQIWQCVCQSESIYFVNLSNQKDKKIYFPLEQFLVEARLPFPPK
jgi:hypothetical protein